MLKRRAFTLIEMLTVVAITAVLMGLIIIPLVQSFNLTRAAQAFSEAQDKARFLIEKISNEVANSAGIRDNEGLKGAVGIRVPGRPVALGGTNGGNLESLIVLHSKLDLYRPAEGDPTNTRDNAFVDPDNQHADPTLRAPRGQVVLPATPGMTLVRYWIGLRQPLAANGLDSSEYNNPYDGLLMPRSGFRDNLFVLYRGEVQPYIFQNGVFRVNTDVFADDDNDGKVDDLDDPWFFVQDAPGQNPALRASKARRIKGWLKNSTIVTEFARYDMIQPVFNKANRAVVYDGNVPRILPLVSFRPTRVSDEPAAGQQAVRLGEETDNMGAVASDVFKTQFGSWANAVVRLYPTGWDGTNSARNHYEVGRKVDTPNGQRFRIFRYDPDLDNDGDDTNGEGDPTDDIEFMDVTTYEEVVASGLVYAFTRAVVDSDSRSGWLGNAVYRAEFVPFTPEPSVGRLNCGFAISDSGVDIPNGGPRRPDNNLPTVSCGQALTPVVDPAPPGNFYDYENDINRRYNKIYADYPNLRGTPYIQRFIDLRVVTSPDGASSPLNPQTGFTRAQIIPGSEVVIGPDQNPGPNYGQAIRYTRTTSQTPGLNQYRLNFVDQKEPADYSLLGFSNPPGIYDRQNFVSAVIQSQFKAGYLQLYSGADVPLPVGNISVYYRFQMTKPDDSVAVDYDTRKVMSIKLTIRNYPQTTLASPQDITLMGSATVRNYVR